MKKDKDVYVDCGADCKALKKPKTLDEFKAALKHWQTHSVSNGCAHGR